MSRQENLESDSLAKEMGYLPKDEEGSYIMDQRDALTAMIAGIMGQQGDEGWATTSERRTLNQIMEDEGPQDFNDLKKRIDE